MLNVPVTAALFRSTFLVAVLTVTVFSESNSGIFVEAHVSRGEMGGNLYHYEGTQIGVVTGDSICYLLNGIEGMRENEYSIMSSYPVEFQYGVAYAVTVGYERAFSRSLALQAAIGYQHASMDAYGARMISNGRGEYSEEPFVDALIDRHWLTVPVNLKVTIPVRRGGIFLAMGPKASFLLSSRYKDNITSFSYDLGKATPRFNLGIGIRAGVEIPVSRIGFVVVEAGYYYGLLNTAPVSEGKVSEGEIIPIGLGFRVNLP